MKNTNEEFCVESEIKHVEGAGEVWIKYLALLLMEDSSDLKGGDET